jgi:hypothetical protein
MAAATGISNCYLATFMFQIGKDVADLNWPGGPTRRERTLGNDFTDVIVSVRKPAGLLLYGAKLQLPG